MTNIADWADFPECLGYGHHILGKLEYKLVYKGCLQKMAKSSPPCLFSSAFGQQPLRLTADVYSDRMHSATTTTPTAEHMRWSINK